HVAQEALFLRRAVPSLLHRNAPSVGKCEGCYVDGIPESMFGDARATRADHAAARVRRDLLDLDNLRTEPTHRGWLHALAHPVVERRNERTRERRCRRQRCRRSGSHTRRSGPAERRRAAGWFLINRRSLRRPLIDWRRLRALRRIRTVRQYCIVRNIVGYSCRVGRNAWSDTGWAQLDRPSRRAHRRGAPGWRRPRHPAHARLSRLRRHRLNIDPIDRCRRRVARLVDRPVRHLRRVWNGSWRTQVVAVAHRRSTFAKYGDLEREIGAAHARPFDRLHAHNAGAELHGAGLHALNFCLMSPSRTLTHEHT